MAKRREIRNSTAEFLIFQAEAKEQGVEVYYKDENIWATQRAMATLFDVNVPAIIGVAAITNKKKQLFKYKKDMGKFSLMALTYAPEALEPVISRETIAFHHGKHLAAYVNNLNGLLEGSGFEDATLEEIVCKAQGGILNNAGQILNHELYFGQFTAPKADNQPVGKLAEAIVRDFGSFDAFKEAFQKAGATLFGSGWVWLSADKDGKLVITQETNAANPVQKGLKPLLTFDVWEHAYYLDYQNRRPDHLAALWQIIDWSVIESR